MTDQLALLPAAPPRHDAGGKTKLPLLPGHRGAAQFDGPGDCYRLWLTRDWSPKRAGEPVDMQMPEVPAVLWIGMNPSTAEVDVDDPTIRRELAFTAAWGFDAYCKINVGDYRATNPRDLAAAIVPLIAPGAVPAKARMARNAARVVMAFGSLPRPLVKHGRALVLALQHAGVEMLCLGVNGDGSPKHPLYLRKDLQPQIWRPELWLQVTR